MPKVFKQLLISAMTAVVLVLGVAAPAFAQAKTTTVAPWYSQDLGTWYAKVYNPANPNEIFGERYTAAQVNWVFWGFVSFALNLATGFNPVISGCVVTVVTGNAGTCTTQVLNSLKSTNAQFKIGDNGKSKSVFAQIFQEDRTLSGITSIRDLGRKFHIVPVAKAQTPGFGYTAALGIIPDIQNAWNQIRDVSYAIFVFVIIIFAFMIMFRIKISPQVIISVQSALPKIAIALVLVTFSYAIAGFLIDIMYVVIGIMALIFSKFAVAGVDFGSAGNTVAGYFDLFTKGPIFLGISTGVFGLMIMYLVNYFLAYILLVVLGFLSGFISTGGLGGSVVAVFAFIIGFIGLILVLIIG